MSAVVHVPASLAGHTGGSREVTVTGADLAAVIDEMEVLHPGIKPAICDDRGALLRFVAIFVDGVDVRSLDGLKTSVGPEAEIDILAAIAGG